jgi:hypothetical protein
MPHVPRKYLLPQGPWSPDRADLIIQREPGWTQNATMVTVLAGVDGARCKHGLHLPGLQH